MPHFDEKHLITRIQHGDIKAFNPLVRKYQPKIYTFIQKQVKDTETAKNLTQETFLKAFRAIKSFRGDAAFSSWIYRIAKNVCIDCLRKQKAFYDIYLLHAINEHCITDTHPAPCRDLEHQELRAYLRAAIQRLTHTRKQVFLLYYEQDLSIKQIAIRLKKSEGTIKTHLRNARLQLRKFLTPYLKNQHIPWIA